ncbi:hypothetical protein KJ940_03995, partial [Myxococcota bacterium]|nr:hypothetical protein [Myxococcota bacterium]
MRTLTLILTLVAVAHAQRPYQTNPTYGAPAAGIIIDGDGSDWSDAQLIALDMANDDPRTLGDNWTLHETPWDLTHLWAAWDDEALYLAWQYVDVTDKIDPNNAGSSGGTAPNQMDLIQWIAIDTIPGAGASVDMWGKNGGEPYWIGQDLPDYQIYIASNLWQGYISRAVGGAFVVDDDGTDYLSVEAAGITAKTLKQLAASTLWGVGDADDRDDPSALRDFLSEGHDGGRDCFYEMRIPYDFLQIDRAYVEDHGLGVMLGQGEFSCMDTIPNDPATTDTSGVESWNSSLEWSDVDQLSVPFARIGSQGGGEPPVGGGGGEPPVGGGGAEPIGGGGDEPIGGGGDEPIGGGGAEPI